MRSLISLCVVMMFAGCGRSAEDSLREDNLRKENFAGLRDADPRVRETSLIVLKADKPGTVKWVVENYFASPKPNVRKAGARLLYEIVGYDDTAEKLVSAYKNDPRGKVQEEARAWLVEYNPERTLTAVENNSADIRGLGTLVQAESSARTAADAELGRNIEKEKADRIAADAELNRKIEQEKADRIAAINKEISARTKVVKDLDERLSRTEMVVSSMERELTDVQNDLDKLAVQAATADEKAEFATNAAVTAWKSSTATSIEVAELKKVAEDAHNCASRLTDRVCELNGKVKKLADDTEREKAEKAELELQLRQQQAEREKAEKERQALQLAPVGVMPVCSGGRCAIPIIQTGPVRRLLGIGR